MLCCSVDEMGNRIDDLETSIAELMQQAGIDMEMEKEGDEGSQVSGGQSK